VNQPPLRATIIPVTPLQQNCTLFWCTATMRAAVVDPGGDLPRIRSAIAQAGVTVEKVLVTHGHLDHCGMAGPLAKELGVPIEGPHEADRFWIARLPDDSRQWGVPAELFEPDRWLDEGDEVTVGDLTLDTYLTPGHTPGHVIFHHPPSKLAIVGDVLFAGSVGRTDFPLSDPDALIRSVVTKLWPLGDDTTFLPGHGPASSFGRERATNPFVGDAMLGA
jgi:glyoxylase-like metal-dependent hydrolase (beta-lactamase superfamily II)